MAATQKKRFYVYSSGTSDPEDLVRIFIRKSQNCIFLNRMGYITFLSDKRSSNRITCLLSSYSYLSVLI